MRISGLAAPAETLSQQEILNHAAAVPPRHHYPTVDELHGAFAKLAAEHPEAVSCRRIGCSRAGEPILLYSIEAAAGEAAAGVDDTDQVLSGLLVGGVHPNEPIGSWTMLHLAQQVLDDPELRRRLAVSWHLLPCADPDAMRLNEAWFGAPRDRTRYFGNFYRPAGREQVEWTFPFSYKSAHFDAMLPETEALQRAIDLIRPDFYMPLHNAESGGAYYYLSEPMEPLHELLSALPESLGVPLHRGEPEAAHFAILAPGIFAMGTLEEAYDWMEALGLDPFPEGSTGESSTGYARRYGTLSLVAEMPMWKHANADDVSVTEQDYAQALDDHAGELASSGELLMGMLQRWDARAAQGAAQGGTASHISRLDEDEAGEPPLMRASRAFLPLLEQAAASQRARAAESESQRPATLAELHALDGILHMLRLRFGGMFLRALQAEAAGHAAPLAAELAAQLEPVYAAWLDESRAEEQHLEAIPIRDVVGLQYGAVLALAAHARRRDSSVTQKPV